DIISASTLISDGTFSTTDNSLLFDFTAIKDGNTVDLTLTAAPTPAEPDPVTPPSVEPPASSTGLVSKTVRASNAKSSYGAAAALDKAFTANPGGDLAALFVGLQTEGQVN